MHSATYSVKANGGDLGVLGRSSSNNNGLHLLKTQSFLRMDGCICFGNLVGGGVLIINKYWHN